MASLNQNAAMLPLPAIPQAQGLDALMDRERGQPASPDSVESPRAKAAAHPAMLRSRSNHSSERRRLSRQPRLQGAAHLARRALPSAFEAAADPAGIVAEHAVTGAAEVLHPGGAQVPRGRQEPDRIVAVRLRETNHRHEVHIDILRSELAAALQMMEYRERWWTSGLKNAEAAVGLEMSRVRDNELAASEGMEAQMGQLIGVLRATQSRAEDSSLAALEQQKLASDLDVYAKRLTTQGRMMIKNSEQKQWNLVSELNASQLLLARVQTEAREEIHKATLGCSLLNKSSAR